MARVSGVASIYVSSPNSLSGGPFLLSGTEEQKAKYLTPVVKDFISFITDQSEFA